VNDPPSIHPPPPQPSKPRPSDARCAEARSTASCSSCGWPRRPKSEGRLAEAISSYRGAPGEALSRELPTMSAGDSAGRQARASVSHHRLLDSRRSRKIRRLKQFEAMRGAPQTGRRAVKHHFQSIKLKRIRRGLYISISACAICDRQRRSGRRFGRELAAQSRNRAARTRACSTPLLMGGELDRKGVRKAEDKEK